MAGYILLTDSEKTTADRVRGVVKSLEISMKDVAVCCPHGTLDDLNGEVAHVLGFDLPLSQWDDVELLWKINNDIQPAHVVILIEAEELRPAGNYLLPFSYYIRSMESCYWVDVEGASHDISEPVIARMKNTRDWASSGEGFYFREYKSYEDYIKVQCSKYKKEEEKIKADTERLLYPRFKERFETVAPLLPEKANVICIGARSGWEVKAYRDLGHNGIGIDLYPGKDNPYVVYGDAHALEWPDGIFDLVYCNVIDHLPYMDKFMAEVGRVLNENGMCFFEFGRGTRAEECEALAWESGDVLIEYLESVCGTVEVLQDKYGVVQFVARMHK